jgi:hypothetical protein
MADQQESLADRVDLLAERGPDLGRRLVDRIHSSRHHHMKELRPAKGGALRVLFMFDPRRQVILLLGGDKSGDWKCLVRVGRAAGRRPLRHVPCRTAR